MRSRFPIVLVILLAAGAGVATAALVRAGSETQPKVQAPARPTQRILFQVEGLTCGSCEGRVRKALMEKPGVRAVDVNLDQKTVTVEYEEGNADPKDLADRITRLGYPTRYVASGPGVQPARKATGKPAGGCGGDCCKGGS